MSGKGFALIAGERRFRAVRDYTDIQTIETKVLEADDIGARRVSASENDLRENLSVFEAIETTVGLVDSQLSGDDAYDSLGDKPVRRVAALLARVHATTTRKNRGSLVSAEAESLSNKFVRQVQAIFQSLPNPLK